MNKKVDYAKLNKGFTLIELLIVIVIIGILSGIVLAVINPQLQQTRAKEAVVRATTEKACISLMACAASTVDGTTCNTAVKSGYTIPTGDPGTYTHTISTTTPASAGTVTITGTLTSSGCVHTCTATPATGAFSNLLKSGTCNI